MPKKNASNDTDILEAEVRKAVEEGFEVQERVRKITVQMIGRGRSFDIQSMQETASAVLRGALAGVETELKEASAESKVARERLREAVGGLDVALAQFAEAAKLAVQEAAGRAEKYSTEDLTRARQDVEKLEQMFLNTLRESASATTEAAGDILRDLASHARVQGSAVGKQTQETVGVISAQIRRTGSAQASIGLHLARNTADLLRQIAAGVLTGLADHVRPTRAPVIVAPEAEHETEPARAAGPHAARAAHAPRAVHARAAHAGSRGHSAGKAG